MKKKYSIPQTICVPTFIDSSLMEGSYNDHADSKRQTLWEESVTSEKVADEAFPHYSLWED
jgi:hypothetical protein